MNYNENQSSNTSANSTDLSPNTAISNFASETASHLQNTINKTVETATQVAEITLDQAQHLLEQATRGTGNTLAVIAENPLVQSVTNLFGADWIKAILGEVNLKKAQESVEKLRQKYPQETQSQIAHRIILEKSIYAGGVGLATNIIPPIAAALFAIDLATTTRLQAEMIYQIAAAYGLDLEDSARRGEVLAIFGLSLGGSGFLKTGLGVIEILPGLGAFVGASSNAAMLYALGYAACRFYENKLQPEPKLLTPAQFNQEREDYLKLALEQETIMDQILAHAILASYPEKSWSDLVPELQQGNLQPHTIDAIATHLENPQPLKTLLNQLHPDFAPSVLVQCNRIAQSNGVITSQEQDILDAIAQKFNLSLNEMKATMSSEL